MQNKFHVVVDLQNNARIPFEGMMQPPLLRPCIVRGSNLPGPVVLLLLPLLLTKGKSKLRALGPIAKPAGAFFTGTDSYRSNTCTMSIAHETLAHLVMSQVLSRSQVSPYTC
jgi:hypothetical protein